MNDRSEKDPRLNRVPNIMDMTFDNFISCELFVLVEDISIDDEVEDSFQKFILQVKGHSLDCHGEATLFLIKEIYTFLYF